MKKCASETSLLLYRVMQRPRKNRFNEFSLSRAKSLETKVGLQTSIDFDRAHVHRAIPWSAAVCPDLFAYVEQISSAHATRRSSKPGFLFDFTALVESLIAALHQWRKHESSENGFLILPII
jgi:hypothetical protein